MRITPRKIVTAAIVGGAIGAGIRLARGERFTFNWSWTKKD